MKKWVLCFMIFVLSLSFYHISQASNEGRRLSDFDNHTLLRQSMLQQPKKQLEAIMLLPDDPFDEKEAANVISRLSVLPSTLLDKIASKQISVKLFEGKLTDNESASHLRGIIPRGYQSKTTWDDVPGIGGGKTVLVKIGSSERGSGHGSVNLELHELAHSIDHYILEEVKYNQLFLHAWEAERGGLFPDQSYFLLFPEEYFAEAFAMYFYSLETKKELSLKAPLTYGFINIMCFDSDSKPF